MCYARYNTETPSSWVNPTLDTKIRDHVLQYLPNVYDGIPLSPFSGEREDQAGRVVPNNHGDTYQRFYLSRKAVQIPTTESDLPHLDSITHSNNLRLATQGISQCKHKKWFSRLESSQYPACLQVSRVYSGANVLCKVARGG